MTDYLILQRRPLSARLVFFTARRLEEGKDNNEGAFSSQSSETTTAELIVKEGAFEGEGGVARVRKDVRAGDVVRVVEAAAAAAEEVQAAAAAAASAAATVVVAQLDTVRRWRDGEGRDGRTFNWAPAAAPSPSADATQPPPSSSSARPCCKYYLNTGRCAKGAACPYAHDATAEQRRLWVGERAAARRRRAGGSAREGSGGEEEGGHEGGAAAKAQRARIFAAWIGAAFFGGGGGGGGGGASGSQEQQEGGGAPDSVVDVAGGRGALTFELAPLLGRAGVTLVDPRPLRLSRRQALRLRLREAAAAAARQGGGGGKARWRVEDVLTGEVVSESRPMADGDGGGGDGGGDSAPAPPPVHVFRQARSHFGPELWRSEAWLAAVERAPSGESRPKRPLVAALHPDQATDAALDYALERGLPFAIVPCCVFPGLFPERRLAVAAPPAGAAAAATAPEPSPVRSYEDLVAYLLQRSGGEAAVLPFVGRNVVVYGGGGVDGARAAEADRAAAREAARPPEFARPPPGKEDAEEEDEEKEEDEEEEGDDNDDDADEEEGVEEEQQDDDDGGMFEGGALLAAGQRRRPG